MENQKNPTENDNDHIIDQIMDDFMHTWISDNHGHQKQEQAHQMNNSLSISVCLREEDDYPHPRHLCFKYPFGNSSPKKYCTKCYCYVCEEVAPCKSWSKGIKKQHCQATDSDVWKLEKEKNNKVANVIMVYHTLTISFMHHPNNQPEQINGSAGGMISARNGDWVTGFSMQIHNDLAIHDGLVLPYMGLIEGLKLAWSKGFRYLDVELGYLYHDRFWMDFDKDSASGKYRLRFDPPASGYKRSIWTILKEIESCLNQRWFINVKNAPSVKEESSALALAAMACSWPQKQVYEFPTHPLTMVIRNIAHQWSTNFGSICDANKALFPSGSYEMLRPYCGSD